MLAPVLGILAVAVVVTAGFMLFSRRAPKSAYYPADFPRPMVVAHQGGDGVWPGNTLFAFQKAVELGVDAIETDMRMTKDGVLVITHDDSVDRISNGRGLITDLTFAELKQLDAAYNWSPDGGKTFPYRGMGITYSSVEEVFQALPETRFNIDMKQTDPPVEEAFCRLISQYRMEDQVVAAYFHHKNNVAFRRLCPQVTSSADQFETAVFVLLSYAGLGRAYSPVYASFQVPTEQYRIPVTTSRFIAAAHERGIWVDVWTIDDPAEMKRLIDLGVDGIMTDRPDLLMQVVAASGRRSAIK